MIRWIRRLEPLARRVLIIGLVLLALAIFGGVRSCQTAQTAKTEAKLSTNQADAAIASGVDAVETVGEQSKVETARERSVAAMQKDVDDAETVSDAHAAGASWLCINYNICDG